MLNAVMRVSARPRRLNTVAWRRMFAYEISRKRGFWTVEEAEVLREQIVDGLKNELQIVGLHWVSTASARTKLD
jgi:hypothetical protein